jgi:hypothetical protein
LQYGQAIVYELKRYGMISRPYYMRESKVVFHIKNSVALVPERRTLVGEVSANFCG